MLAVALLAGAAQAQEPTQVQQITVVAPNGRYAAHTDSVAPQLAYQAVDLQTFEPVSIGAMLKRLPGIAFRSEAGAYEAPQLLGIGPEYTQVLIDGQRVAGADENRGVLVDHIPPEMIERVEILRSPTADLDAQGIGGTVNLVLKSAAAARGLELRSDVAHGKDSRLRGGGYLGWGDTQGSLSWLLGAELRRRYEARDKRGTLLDPDGVLLEKRSGTEQRDGVDSSVNAQLAWQADPGRVDLRAFRYGTRHDSVLVERVIDVAEDPPEAGRRFERDQVDEHTTGLDLRARSGAENGAGWLVSVGHGRTQIDRKERAGDVLPEGEVADERERLHARDRETRMRLARHIGTEQQIRVGVQAARKVRDSRLRRAQEEDYVLVDVAAADGSYGIEERRLDGYAQGRWQVVESFTIDTGLRIEHTGLEQSGFDTEGVSRTARDARVDLSPNLHARWDPSTDGRLRLSLARTLRRPDFNQLVPFRTREGDRLVMGNPGLRPERSLGADLGYERILAREKAVLGVNIFFRRIENLIEQRRVAADTVSPVNGRTGEVWGVVFDGAWSTPLGPDSELELSANLGLLDSSVRDPVTDRRRRFQYQPAHVLNIGFEHDLHAMRLKWGSNLTLTGASREFLADEVGHSDHGPEMEAYVEYTVAPTVLLRLTGSDLLESRITETRRTFDGERPAAALDEVAIERETLGPRLMLTVRMKF